MPNPQRQSAALPVREGLVCLVTSRGRGRWVVPKGAVEPGQTPAEAAAAEAWEEAGVSGVVRPVPVGEFRYVKNGRLRHVTAFILDVTAESADWPEMTVRTREWVTPAEAAARVREPDLRALLLELEVVVGVSEQALTG